MLRPFSNSLPARAVARGALSTNQLSLPQSRLASTDSQAPHSAISHSKSQKKENQASPSPSSKEDPPPPQEPQSQEEKDALVAQKLDSISGGGGEAGIELENGQPVAMKRGVRENMFRLI